VKELLIGGIWLYRILFWPVRQLKMCRFEPSCSEYGIQAIRRHGALRGSWLAVRRIARCNPFHCGGHDPIPN
jgi:putative membrane protein insertion efficiency factor